MPVYDTPTYGAMSGGYGELEAFTPASPLRPGGRKALILITDGVPTDRCTPGGAGYDYATNTCVTMAAGELAKAAPEGPILTFVIGVGAFPSTDLVSFDPNFLGNVAKAGGAGMNGCNPNDNVSTAGVCYFEVDPSKASSAAQLQMQFEAAIDSIRAQVVSCTFPLQVDVGLGVIDPTKR